MKGVIRRVCVAIVVVVVMFGAVSVMMGCPRVFHPVGILETGDWSIWQRQGRNTLLSLRNPDLVVDGVLAIPTEVVIGERRQGCSTVPHVIPIHGFGRPYLEFRQW